MSLNRWKVLACTLTVGIGGLAVFATDPNPPKADPVKEPAPLPTNLTVKPSSPANGTDTPAPVNPVKGDEFELTVPVPDVPPPTKPEKPAILPVKSDGGDTDEKKLDPPKKDMPPVIAPPTPADPMVPKVVAPEPPKPDVPKAPPADLDIPIVPKPAGDPPPPLRVDPAAPTTPVAPPAPVKPEALLTPPPPATKTPPAPAAAPAKSESSKLKMLLRMGDGQPRFEIRNVGTTDLLLKVYGEKIEMQGPPDSKATLAGVTAFGRVRFTAPGMEGTCDQLRILSGTGEVLLEGHIHLKTRYGKMTNEMTAEKMVYQIGTGGLTAPRTTRVTPASYVQD
jgi:hypothetical protein